MTTSRWTFNFFEIFSGMLALSACLVMLAFEAVNLWSLAARKMGGYMSNRAVRRKRDFHEFHRKHCIVPGHIFLRGHIFRD